VSAICENGTYHLLFTISPVSMPEWYNPAYPTSGAFGYSPVNPYTGKPVPYTGSPDFKDYVNELQLPQLLELVDLEFNLSIIWSVSS
jgi:alpha-L-fucosidase